MPYALATLYTFLPAGLLVLFRMGGLVMTATLFSSNAIPMRIRVYVAVSLAVVVAPAVWPTLPAGVTLGGALVGTAGELLMGMLLGVAVSLVFMGLELGGLMIGRQAGIALAQIFNPAMETQTTVLGQLYFMTALVVFLVLNGHHVLIRCLMDSFAAVPVLSFVAGEGAARLLVDALHQAMVLGVRLAAPALIALFAASVSLNFVSRTVPQLNILVVGFPIRAMVALVVASLSLYGVEDLFCQGMDEVFSALHALLGLS